MENNLPDAPGNGSPPAGERASKPLPRLEYWSICRGNDLYRPPWCQGNALQGTVYGNSKFEDGDHIRTSHIVEFHFPFASTRHTEYVLGKMKPEFEKWMKENGYRLEDYEK